MVEPADILEIHNMLKDYPTSWLAAELALRDGVTSEFINPYDQKTFVVEGPAQVLINID